jgi:hypothetical protein
MAEYPRRQACCASAQASQDFPAPVGPVIKTLWPALIHLSNDVKSSEKCTKAVNFAAFATFYRDNYFKINGLVKFDVESSCLVDRTDANFV